MGRYTKLFISQSQIEKVMNEFCKSRDEQFKIDTPRIMNKASGQTRYTIVLENTTFNIDFYFRHDNKTTIKEIGSEENRRFGLELAEYILSSLDYSEVETGVMTIKTTKYTFDNLINYLKGIKGVKLVKNENTGVGILYQFVSEIGDKITLTFYPTSGKLLYQGCLLKLYAEVKCFLNPFGVDIKTTVGGRIIETDDIEPLVNKNIPNAYNKIDKVLYDYIYDSFVQMKSGIKCKDYSAWVFPALRGLEAYIKQILLKNGTIINDKLGFAIKKPQNVKPIPIFKLDKNDNKYIVNYNAIVLKDDDFKNALEDCYDYFAKNRHVLFHAKQFLSTSKRLEHSSEAEDIIYRVCELFDKYYLLII